MYDAHEHGDVDAVRKLLDAHPELEEMGPDDDMETWLHVAAEKGHIAVAEFWLGRGYDVNVNLRRVSREKDGLITPLYFAKDAAMTRYLLSRGALVNACGRDEGTPLHSAIVRAVEPSQKGRRRPGGANMDQIRALLDAGADLSLMDGEGYTPLASATELRRKTAEQLLREVGAPEKGRSPFGRRRKKKTLNLQKDFATVYEYVTQRVHDFDPAKHNGLGGPGIVKIVQLGFDFVHAGWVVLVFDTRSNAEADGEWTSEIEGNELKMPHWRQASETNLEQAITLVLIDGSQTVLPARTELAVPLGEMLKAVLLKARASGRFAALPKAPGCELSVEHFDGAYAWPAYDSRGAESLA
jgi:ankyrin repeat protein